MITDGEKKKKQEDGSDVRTLKKKLFVFPSRLWMYKQIIIIKKANPGL